MFNIFKKKEEEPEVAPVAAPAPPITLPAQEMPQMPSLYTPRRGMNPGRFDEMSREAKSIINQQEPFDGIRFECYRNLKDAFTAGHTLSLGSSTEPSTYAFTTSLVTPPYVLHGKVDADGVVNGRISYEKGRYATRLGFQASNEPQNSVVNVDTEYLGRDYTLQAKWQNPSNFVFSYLQSLTKSLSIGCEAFSSLKQGMNGLTFAARYEDAKSVGYIVGVPTSLSVNYVQQLSPACHLAAELVTQASSRGTESVMSWGADVRYRASAWRTNLDSTGRLSCIYEEGMNPFTKLMFSAESDIWNRKYRFGFGLSVQA